MSIWRRAYKAGENAQPFHDYYRSSVSPYINHFLQPDTIIPDPANPQSWNRFSYVQNNPIRFNDPTGHMRTGENGSSKKGCSDSYYCLKGKPKPVIDPCIETKCDLHDRHPSLSVHLPVTLNLESGASVNLPAYYGDYPDDTNVPYIPGVSSGIRGPIPPNPCRGGGAYGCIASLGVDLMLLLSPPSHNANANFSLTFNVEYHKSLEMKSITVSNMQYANRGQQSLLTQVRVGDETFHASNVYMPANGSYLPTQKVAGQFDGSDPLTVNINISVIIPNTPHGAGRLPFSYTYTLPSVP